MIKVYPLLYPLFNIGYKKAYGMANVNYYLKGAISEKTIFEERDKTILKEKLNKSRQIFLKVSLAGSRMQIYTKRRVPQIAWNKKKQEPYCHKIKVGCAELSEFLSEFKSDVIKECNQLENKAKRITKKNLENILEKYTIKKIEESDVLEHFMFFLNNHKTSAGYTIKHNTVKKYISLCNHMIDYFESEKIKFSLQLINLEFFERFQEYLMWDMELSDNTVAKYIKTLKTFTKFYIGRKQIEYFDVSQVKSNEKEGSIFVLTLKQVTHLQSMEIKNEAQANARDVFCFMCWTGQRYSDILNIKNEDIRTINGSMVWEFVTTKTDEKITVPLVEQAIQVLNKYDDFITPLPVISNQKMNKHLKIIGKLADFDESVSVMLYYDGRKQETIVPFYEILTTHVARKSYITNSLTLGIPERVVREVSGHKDEKSFKRYVNLAESYKNQVIQDAFSKENIDKVLN